MKITKTWKPLKNVGNLASSRFPNLAAAEQSPSLEKRLEEIDGVRKEKERLTAAHDC